MTGERAPPERDEFELALFGPGYGESIALHVGDGVWVVVDSCVDEDRAPRALRYLETIGVDPAEAVALIVATNWHDDHICGMAHLVDACNQASFCCAAALCEKEFLSAVAALEHGHLTVAGSGVGELYKVFTHLENARRRPIHALANRRIFVSNGCEVWSLSPSDRAYQNFLTAIGSLVPSVGSAKRRAPHLSPNEAAVALWIEIGDVSVLLGSDLERRGWIEILQSAARPPGKASAFKIAHHGSGNAHVPQVWQRMLDSDPFAILTPWRRGRRALPAAQDLRRIHSLTANAYASATNDSAVASRTRRNRAVDRTIKESSIKMRRLGMSLGAVRLRKGIGSTGPWRVELFGAACHLRNFN